MIISSIQERQRESIRHLRRATAKIIKRKIPLPPSPIFSLASLMLRANSYFEVLGEKAPHIKLTEVNGDAVEEEVSIASSIVDGNKALEVLVESFC